MSSSWVGKADRCEVSPAAPASVDGPRSGGWWAAWCEIGLGGWSLLLYIITTSYVLVLTPGMMGSIWEVAGNPDRDRPHPIHNYNPVT